MSVERRDFLVELGTEELPPKALATLERAFAAGLRTRIDQAGLTHGAIESFATPRRLAVRVQRLAAQQPPQQLKRRGPPLSAAFDSMGQPARSAQAFAQSCGVSIDALGRERDAKGNEYLAYSGARAGASTPSLLPIMVQEALDALPIHKRMRWGAGDAQFVRPVHWLLMLFGREVVPATILGNVAADRSVGHRFMAPAPLRIISPAVYEKTLLKRGKVIAAFAKRRECIRAQVEAAAAEFDGHALIGDALLDEVTALVEWPVAVAGHFEERFLQLPREVLLCTLQDHQRYFAIESNAGELLPRFITISNIDSPQPGLVREGNERVVRPRLSDAAFFWDQDRKQPLAARRPALDGVTFQVQLGSLGAKTQRVQSLAMLIAPAVGADIARIERAALLSKCDLLTAMVGEFPELQGTMGRYYALADGEPAEIADAIREHYLPRGAGDALPVTRVGITLALADKLDTLAGIFAVGQKPSGTKDPFALRRAAIGLLRIILEQRLELNLSELITAAVTAQPLADIAKRAAVVATEIYDYILERLRGQYLEGGAERTSHAGITTEMFDAVLATRPASLPDVDARLRALVIFLASIEGASLAAANKRIANILKKLPPEQQPVSKQSPSAPSNIDAALLREPGERALHEALQGLRTPVTEQLDRRDYRAALAALAGLRGAVDDFFDHVLVNDPDAALRANRLALLAQVRDLFGRIADLSRLPG